VNDADLYNSRIIKTFVEYLDIHYPGLDTKSMLNESGITIYQVNDGGTLVQPGPGGPFP